MGKAVVKIQIPTTANSDKTTMAIWRSTALEGFEGDDQETVIKLIDAMIAKHQMESTLRKLG